MGITSTTLYRMGNASGPKMDNVRLQSPDPDIDHYTDVSGTVWVRAGTGGVSTWETPKTGLRGKVWRIPAGTAFPDRLRVWNSEPGHWLWEPVHNMRLSDFKDDLASVHQFAESM